MAWHNTWNDPPPRRGLFVDRGGNFPPGALLILVATIAVFVLQNVGFERPLVGLGALSVQTLAGLQVWRLVTYMFLHADGTHIFFNMFMFWMLGSLLERQMGTRSFLWLYFVSGIVGGLFETGFNYVMFLHFPGTFGDSDITFLSMQTIGASAGVMGILMAFAVLNPRVKFLVFFLLPVEAWWVALAYAVLETWPIFRDLVLSPEAVWKDNVAHAAHFGGMAVGFAWIKWGGRLGRLLRPQGSGRAAETFVARAPDEEEAELDRILDKIHGEGLDSLTLRERMFLQEISRKRRGGGPDGL